MSNAEVYQQVTDRIIAQLKQGTVPWVKPWNRPGFNRRTGLLRPVNVASRQPYRGINPLLLDVDAQEKGYTSPWWGTYNQWAEKCGMRRQSNSRSGREFWGSPDGSSRGVRKGERGTQIVLWKSVKVNETDPDTGEKIAKPVLLARMFTVFNAEQCSEAPGRYFPQREEWEPVAPIREPQEVLDGYLAKGGPKIVHQTQDRAEYFPGLDRIEMPPRDQFPVAEAYYGTAFHEAGHSTGHKSRLNRPGIASLITSAAMLQAATGIETEAEFTRSAAYVANWLQKLQDDPKMVSQAASQASQAVDLITEPQRLAEIQRGHEDQAEPEPQRQAADREAA
jgi:antirestriction protein ArdC